MAPIRRRTFLWPLVGLSLGLLILPSSWSRKARLTGLSLFRPIKGVACATTALPTPSQNAK